MVSSVRNIRAKNYQNLVIGFQVTVENVGDAFLGHSVFSIFKQICLLSSLRAFCIFLPVSMQFQYR